MSRVLLIDDDRSGLEIRKLLLERHGYDVVTARDVESARARFAERPPGVVILDLYLPGVDDGLALIREFRAASAAVRIVVLSGWTAQVEDREESAMVDEVLRKPVRSERLVEAVGRKARG
jgi:DNA-binding response OmpR family regulator